MDWTPAAGSDPAQIQRAYRQSTGPFFPLNTALEGPDLMRVQYILRPPFPFQTAVPGGAPPYSSTAPPDAGMVRLRMRNDLDSIQEPDLPRIFPRGATLGDIVDLDQTVPGTHAYYALTLGSESKTIGKGRRRSGSPAPGDAGRKKAASCRKRGIASVRVKALRGKRIRSVRARAGGRRVRARVTRGGFVRVNLRRLSKPTYRVRITVVMRSGKRATFRRTARRCPAPARR
jgi:hypothetical protein